MQKSLRRAVFGAVAAVLSGAAVQAEEAEKILAKLGPWSVAQTTFANGGHMCYVGQTRPASGFALRVPAEFHLSVLSYKATGLGAITGLWVPSINDFVPMLGQGRYVIDGGTPRAGVMVEQGDQMRIDEAPALLKALRLSVIYPLQGAPQPIPFSYDLSRLAEAVKWFDRPECQPGL